MQREALYIVGLESCNGHDAHRWMGALNVADSILRSKLEKVWDDILDSMRGERKKENRAESSEFCCLR